VARNARSCLGIDTDRSIIDTQRIMNGASTPIFDGIL
jgi:hypothetical protein